MLRNPSSISRGLASVKLSPSLALTSLGVRSSPDLGGERGYSMPSMIRRSRETPPSSAARAS